MLFTIADIPWKWKMYYIISAILILFLFLEAFVDYPYGLLPLHSFYGKKYGKPSICGWDYEASWKIGIAYGTSPFDLKVNNSPIITCATLDIVNASFVADPFLFRAENSKWFAFYEFKNLNRIIGEIGVAVSLDFGISWSHVSTALKEPFHLSYPFVIEHKQSGDFLMIPETNQANSIRIYKTDAKSFPLGWKLHKTVLEGAPFVDTSAVWFKDRYWIFTTANYQLYLFHSMDLLGEWTPHPLNPVVTSASYARSGGPPVVYNGHIYRFAQDCARFYGEQVHIMKLENLALFEEKEVATMKPAGEGALWYSVKLHHVDAHDLGNGAWIALVDGDDRGQYMQFYLREGWFRTTKLILLGIVASQFVALFIVSRYLKRPMPDSQNPYYHIRYIICEIKAMISLLTRFCSTAVSSAKSSFSIQNPCQNFISICAIAVCSILVALCLMLVPFYYQFIDLKQCCPDDNNSISFPLVTAASPSTGLGAFVVITAATQHHFDRLRNFIGSMHVWEPGQIIMIYDLGLHAEQVQEVNCWKNVTLKQFPFAKYPLHIRNAYNYAWKPLILQDAFHSFDTVLALDSGVELRQPLSSIKEKLSQNGYFVASQSNTIDKKTHETTFIKLNVKKANFEGKQFCSGGIQGYKKETSAYKKVLQPAIVCALDEDCIAPEFSGRENHNYDQSVLSILMYNNGFSCVKEERFAQGAMDKLTWNELKRNDAVLSLRRWKIPKPYTSHILKKQECPSSLPYKLVDYEVIETSNSFRVEADSPLQSCLRKSKNQRQPCSDLIAYAQDALSRKETVLFEARVRYFGVVLLHIFGCSRFYHILFLVFLAGLVSWLLKKHYLILSRRQAALSILDTEDSEMQENGSLLTGDDRPRRRRPALDDAL